MIVVWFRVVAEKGMEVGGFGYIQRYSQQNFKRN